MPAYGAMAAALSLIVAQWPFVAAAADRLGQVGEPSQKLGLKRAAGWFTLANLVALVASVFGQWLAVSWAIIVPPVNDPLFHLANPIWSIVFDILPFFVFSIIIGTVAVWAMNLLPPRPERVRRASLALLIAGQYVLAYLIVGLMVYVTFSPTLGGYEQVLPHGDVRPTLAQIDARIWYVEPSNRQVRSVRSDGSAGQVEWAGPAPRDAMSMWIMIAPDFAVQGETAGGKKSVASRLVFVCPDRLVIVELPGGKVSEHRAAATTGPDRARPPATAEEVAAALGVPAADVLPRDGLRLAAFRRPGLTRDMTRWLRQESELEREMWVRLRGQGRRLPEIPTRPEWQEELELQPLGGDLILARYGDRLIVLDTGGGWIAPVGVRAEMFVVVEAFHSEPACTPAALRLNV